MLRFVIFSVVLAVSCALFIPGDNNSVVIFDDGTNNVTHLGDPVLGEQMDNGSKCPTCLNITYTFGKRVNGDRLVRTKNFAYAFEYPFEMNSFLEYPEEGPDANGSIVSYVESFTRQTNNLSTATIVKGGIGQRFILIHVNALNVTHFEYVTRFYGHD